MNTENDSASSPSHRRFGAAALVLAIVATAVLAGGAWLPPGEPGRGRSRPRRRDR